MKRSPEKTFTVGEVARLAQVSIRTLHHFDAEGLLKPSLRSEAGYRLYSQTDLERLQQVLIYRAVGMPLGRIRSLLAQPTSDRQKALLEQRDVLHEEMRRIQALLKHLDQTLESIRGAPTMSSEALFSVFGEFNPETYAPEAQSRWGQTDAWKHSHKRTQKYSKADWERYKQEAEEATLAMARLLERGIPPDAPEALQAVEQNRLLIDRWFYPCSREMHAHLGQLYVSDPRFEANYEKVRPGLARYFSEATAANAMHGEPRETVPPSSR